MLVFALGGTFVFSMMSPYDCNENKTDYSWIKTLYCLVTLKSLQKLLAGSGPESYKVNYFLVPLP